MPPRTVMHHAATHYATASTEEPLGWHSNSKRTPHDTPPRQREEAQQRFRNRIQNQRKAKLDLETERCEPSTSTWQTSMKSGPSTDPDATPSPCSYLRCYTANERIAHMQAEEQHLLQRLGQYSEPNQRPHAYQPTPCAMRFQSSTTSPLPPNLGEMQSLQLSAEQELARTWSTPAEQIRTVSRDRQPRTRTVPRTTRDARRTTLPESHACTHTPRHASTTPDPLRGRQLDDVRDRQLSSRQLSSRQKPFTPAAVGDPDQSLHVIRGPNDVARGNLPGDDRRKISPMHGGFAPVPTTQRSVVGWAQG